MSEQVNLKNFKVITDKLNNYFKDNKFMVGSSVPTSGTYKVGDIVVNSGSNSAEVPMWICIEAGTPGTWEVFNSGGMNETELQNYITNIVQTQAISAVDYTDGTDIQIDGGSIGDLNELQTSNKESVVGAINELFQNANNGKELIADAIGEPVSSDDTFSAMSNDIHGLLSTFKTNMMKNGVTVDSGDKFKQLIDKIATMIEDGKGKGIQYATGTVDDSDRYIYQDSAQTNLVIPFENGLDFTPTIVFFCCNNLSTNVTEVGGVTIDAIISNDYHLKVVYPTGTNYHNLSIINITNSGFSIKINNVVTNSASTTVKKVKFKGGTYHAIGIGEEDTTLRDSLANILGDKGVEVNPEDDMATLIGKVDSMNSGGLDIISATELPATGKENQICVITDNPVDKYLLSGNYNDKTTDNTIFIYTNSSSEESILYETGKNIVTRYYLSSIYQGDATLSSYTYKNGVWNKLTSNSLVLLSGSYYNTNVFGEATLGASSLTTNGWTITASSLFAAGLISTNTIDFSKYKSVKIRGYVTSNITSPLDIYVGSNTLTSSYVNNAWSGMMMPFGSTQHESYYFTNYTKFTIPTGAIVPNVEFETDIDISSITGGYRFRLGISSRSSTFASNGGNIVITSLELLL